jgi:DNA-binding beta-propeller fold protein YncE
LNSSGFSLAVALATLAFAGCGSAETNPPPAEPITSPPLSQQPAGKVRSAGSEAEGVVVDPVTGLAAISFRDPNRIELIDVATGETVKRIPTPDPARHLSLAAPGGPVLAPIEYVDELLRIELPSGKTSSVAVGDFPHDAAQAANGRIFVSDEGGDTVSVVDGDSVEVALPSPEQPGGIAVSGDTVAVVAVAAREVAFLDADTLEQVAVLGGGAGPSHVVAGPDDGSNRFYVTDTGGDAILVYEGGDEPRLLDRTNLPGSPYGIAVDGRRNRLWVTQTARNRVAELEVSELAPKIVASYPTVRQPNSVGVDERTGDVVVVGRDSGDVQIFNPDESGNESVVGGG